MLFKITRSEKWVINILATIFLPGTIMHELSHLLTAGIMLIPVGEISVYPEIVEGGVKLGSVQIGKSDPFRRIIVGVAPVLTGMLSILGILYFANLDINHIVLWQVVISLYLVFEIGNTMFSSKKDLEGAIEFVGAILIVAVVVLITLHFLSPAILEKIWVWLNKLNLESVVKFFKLGSIFLLIPLGLDIILILLTMSFRRRY